MLVFDPVFFLGFVNKSLLLTWLKNANYVQLAGINLDALEMNWSNFHPNYILENAAASSAALKLLKTFFTKLSRFTIISLFFAAGQMSCFFVLFESAKLLLEAISGSGRVVKRTELHAFGHN